MKVTEKELKEITLSEFDRRDTEMLSELIQEVLTDRGIDVVSFSFCIQVSYLEEVSHESN